jgi:hypothetical protein
MAYIGNSPANVGNYQIVDTIAGSFNASSTSFALASGGITITPAKSGQLLVAINGVMQQPDDTGTNGFKVSGSNIVFSSPPASGDTFWAVYQGQNVDIGTPSDDVVDTAHMKDDAITAAKLANSINTEIAANTAKATNATHTGDVTGSGALTIANDAVDIAMLSATGTASSSTFLRGDNSWQTAGSTSASDLTSGTLPIARIADDAITLAKMAPGTDGNIISYDASGDPVAIATGSDGQVLTSTGAGSPPAFETLSAGPTHTSAGSAPGSPAIGDFWHDTTNEKLYIRTNDGTSNIWMQI